PRCESARRSPKAKVKGSGCNEKTKKRFFDRDTPCLDIRGYLRVRPRRQSGILQTFTVLSRPPVARRLPSGLKATAWPTDPRSLRPRNSRSALPLRVSHTLVTLSEPKDAARLPSGLNATRQT